MKFRVWDKSINYMDYRVRVTTTDDYIKVEVLDAFSDWRELKEGQYELMQSTGLVDENGEEIFEGDILTDEGSFASDSWDYATIEFDETDYTYYITWKNEGICESITECENYAVAGNIYENRDLMIEERDKIMNFEELRTNVEQWAKDKDLLHSENNDKQFMKFIEEVFEFKSEMDFLNIMGRNTADIYEDYEYIETQENMKLEMGDIFVTLIILCKQLGIDCVECLQMAYDKISKRKGVTKDGIFIKEEDL